MSFNLTILAEEISTNSPFVLEAAGEIIYDYNHGVVTAFDSVLFQTDQIIITADSLAVDTKQKQVTAEGKEVKLITEERTLTGSYLVYDYDSNQGSFYDAESKLTNLYFKGEEIYFEKESDSQITVDKASLTKCIFTDDPHYHIKARKIYIYPEEKIVADHVEFWLGKYKIFMLPGYTMKYNEETGTYENIIPITDIGYDQETGIYYTLQYPYQIGEQVTGELFAQKDTSDDRLYRWTNKYKIINNLILDSRLYYDKDLEMDDTFTIDQQGRLGLRYNFNHYSLYNYVDYDFDDEKTTLNSVLQYNNNPFKAVIGYAYIVNTELYKRSLDLTYYASPFTWNLKYRTGYSVDYLPYLSVNYNKKYKGYSFSSTLGGGQLQEGNTILDKVLTKLKLSKTYNLLPNLSLDLKGEYWYNYYLNDEPSSYEIFNGQVGLKHRQKLTPKLSLTSSLGYELITDRGDYLLPSDKLDTDDLDTAENSSGQYLKPGLEFSYQIPEDYSSWGIGLTGKYELEEEDWEGIKIKLKRTYDCFDYSFSYDIIKNSFGFGINF